MAYDLCGQEAGQYRADSLADLALLCDQQWRQENQLVDEQGVFSKGVRFFERLNI